MAKTKTTYFCSSCGAQSAKWIGKCPSCDEWNTYSEEIQVKSDKHKASWRESSTQTPSKPQKIDEINADSVSRITTGEDEFDRILGGGIVKGSIILIGGEPGIGKSTYLLQVALGIPGHKVLYVTGEESVEQIKMRSDRLTSKHADCYILSETNLENVFQQVKQMRPDVLIVDSIQTLQTNIAESAPGTVTQIRECAAQLQRYAKTEGVPVFVIGHITKEGAIAGPKVLEHIVDAVLQFEGDRNHQFRILRNTKNRFGSTAEIGIYEMRADGLSVIGNPSEVLINQRDEQLSGIAIGASLEGIRPLMIEVQALVGNAIYGTPQRSATGFDLRRLNMLLAVLDKRLGMPIGAKDVFVNIAGGLKIIDPAMDLCVLAALYSSFEDMIVSPHTVYIGEVSLSGEIRTASRLSQRLKEAERLGFKTAVVSKYSEKALQEYTGKMSVVPVSSVGELVYQIQG